MNIERIQQPDGSLFLIIEGDMDARGCHEVQPIFDELVAQPTLCDITLNLKAVDFLDSSGIGAIVFLFKRLKAKGHSLSLTHVQGQPMELMNLLRIHHAMPVSAA